MPARPIRPTVLIFYLCAFAAAFAARAETPDSVAEIEEVVLGDDLSVHVGLGTSTHPSEGLGAYEESCARWRFEDRNEDGHPDLVLDSGTYLNDGMCAYDDGLVLFAQDLSLRRE